MSKFTRRAMAVCATTAMGVAAFVATATGRPSGGCHASFLKARMSVVHGSQAAGHVEYLLTVKNDGPGPCVVRNHPKLQLIGAQGQHLPTNVKDEGPAGAAAMQHGGTLSAKLRFSPDIPGPGEPAHGACEPAAHHVSVTLKDGITVVGAVEPPTSVCEHGTIQEHPLS